MSVSNVVLCKCFYIEKRGMKLILKVESFKSLYLFALFFTYIIIVHE